MKAAGCISYGFIEIKLKVSGFHRHKSVSSGAYQKIEVLITAGISLFYKLFSFSCLPEFIMPGFCMNTDDYLKMLSLSW